MKYSQTQDFGAFGFSLSYRSSRGGASPSRLMYSCTADCCSAVPLWVSGQFISKYAFIDIKEKTMSGYLDILDIIIIRWMYYKLLTISDPEWWEQVKQWRPPTLCKTCSNNFAKKGKTLVFDVNQIKLISNFKPHNMYLCCRENQKDKQLPSRHHSSLMLTLITASESGNFTFFLIARFEKKTLGIRSFSTIQPDSL